MSPPVPRGKCLALSHPPHTYLLVKLPIYAPAQLILLFSQVSKCLIEFQTRQLHRSLGDRSLLPLSLSLLAADSVLKETDKNSESFTVHRSLAQACFDPTPAATAAAAPTATPYFNAIKHQDRKREEERDPKTKFLFRPIR